MSKPVETSAASHPIAAASWFAGAGTALTIAAGLSFLFVCMILPLVGKAGVQTVHAKQNHYAFLAALLVSLLLSAAATGTKLARRRIDRSPLPRRVECGPARFAVRRPSENLTTARPLQRLFLFAFRVHFAIPARRFAQSLVEVFAA